MRMGSLGRGLLLSAILIPLASCSSIPGKTSSNDCLVIIKTVILNPDKLTLGREYLLHYTGEPGTSRLGDNGGNYLTVVVGDENLQTTFISTEVRPGMTGPSGQMDFVYPLPYRPGEILVADFVLEWSLWRTSEGHYMSSIKSRKITVEERQDLIGQVRQDIRFESWTRPQR